MSTTTVVTSAPTQVTERSLETVIQELRDARRVYAQAVDAARVARNEETGKASAVNRLERELAKLIVDLHREVAEEIKRIIH